MIIDRALTIIKKRWPEAAMVIGLYAGAEITTEKISLFLQESMDTSVRLSFGASFFMALGASAIMIVVSMLVFGFLKSAATEPDVRRRPTELLQLGRAPFWRLLLLGLISLMIVPAVASVFYSILYFLIFKQMPSSEPKDLVTWLQYVSFFLSICLLVKPIILIPSYCILNNTSLSEALLKYQQLHTIHITPLILVTCGLLSISLILTLLTELLIKEGVFQWMLWLIQGIFSGSVLLLIYITAMNQIQTCCPGEESKKSHGNLMEE